MTERQGPRIKVPFWIDILLAVALISIYINWVWQ